ncbi:MAG: PbpA [bacterium]|nr:PbpA [bacterium]
MLLKKKPNLSKKRLRKKRPGWRKYQVKLNRSNTKKSIIKKICKFSTVVLFLFVVYHIMTGGPGEAVYYNDKTADKQKTESLSPGALPSDSARITGKEAIHTLLDSKVFVNFRKKKFDFTSKDEQRLLVDTTIDESLQNFIIDSVDLSTSRYVGIVVMDPYTGKIISMVGFDKADREVNPCLSTFPAASIFKIVTASAVVEKCGFNPHSVIKYRGGKYTLYKYQLRKEQGKRANRITLKDSFAKSVNPVFGKIGIHYLGRSALEEYAGTFGFNRNINFEIPLPPSSFSITDKPYRWAEIASGFNRETLMSPLHGAMIASAILNRGNMAEPVIIEQITDENGHALYKAGDVKSSQAVRHSTSATIKDMMKATIKSGTCRKMFRGYRKDRTLSKLDIGGKSGSINSRKHEGRRYDWFVGYAGEKEGNKKIAISVLIAHEKYIGKRAAKYARIIIKEYFNN